MGVSEQKTEKECFSDKGYNFFRKKVFLRKNAVFYEEKVFFSEKTPFFHEKTVFFRKKWRPGARRRELKNTSDVVRSRRSKRLFTPVLCAPKSIFLASQGILTPLCLV